MARVCSGSTWPSASEVCHYHCCGTSPRPLQIPHVTTPNLLITDGHATRQSFMSHGHLGVTGGVGHLLMKSGIAATVDRQLKRALGTGPQDPAFSYHLDGRGQVHHLPERLH